VFTGLIEETGLLLRRTLSPAGFTLEIEADKVLEGTRIGDSIAVNGVCLTVVDMGVASFTVEAVKETVEHSTIPDWRIGEPLNLERALAVGDRFGGHFVQGHIDGVGTIKNLVKGRAETKIIISCGSEIARYIVYKGSIAIDGISLSVAKAGSDNFTTSIIPHTWVNTNLNRREIGDRMNLETDLIAKYVGNLLQRGNSPSGLTEDDLRRAGF